MIMVRDLLLILTTLACSALAYAEDLAPIGTLEEFSTFSAPAVFDHIIQHHSDGSYVACANATNSSTNRPTGYQIFWSADARTWEQTHSAASTGLYALATGGGQTMLAGYNGQAVVSSDGKTWTRADAPPGATFTSLLYEGGSFYGLRGTSDVGVLYTNRFDLLEVATPQLMRWEAKSGWTLVATLPIQAKRILHHNGVWLAAGSNYHTMVQRSDDATTWRTIWFSYGITDIAAGGGRFMASYPSGFWKDSTDASTWHNFYDGFQIKGMFRAGGRFVGFITHLYNQALEGLWFSDVPKYGFYSYQSFPDVSCAAASNDGIIVAGGKNDASAYIKLSRPAETKPVITTDLEDINAYLFQGATLGIKATGGRLNFQWYEGYSGDTSRPIFWANVSTQVYLVDRNIRYWVRVSNELGHTDSRTCHITAKALAQGSILYESQPSTPDELVGIASVDSQLFGLTDIRWTRNGYGVPAGRSAILTRPRITLADAGTYTATVFYEGVNYTSDPLPVVVVRRTVTIGSLTGEGESTTLKQVTAGPGATYDWIRPDSSVIEDEPGHISGATTASLALTNLRPEDEGWYTCIVSNSYKGLEGMSHYVTVEPIPQLEDMETPEGAMVARSLKIQPQSRNLVQKYEVRGLPPGMAFNSKTGAITGSPTKAGTYKVQVRAHNFVGASPWKMVTVRVDPLPAALVGEFEGLVGRIVGTNEGMGGACKVVTTATGAVTGFVDVGSKRYPFTGKLDCTQSGTSCVTTRSAAGQLVVQLGFQETNPALTGTVSASDNSYTLPIFARKVGASAQTKFWAGKKLVEISPVESKTDTPQGQGAGTITVSTVGGFTWVGKLSDGAAYTMGGRLTADGWMAARTLLYTKRGSLQGWQQIDGATAKPNGALEWMKNATPGAKSYPQGIPLHTLNVRPKA